MKIILIVAIDNKGGISKNHKIPWNFPRDMKHFRETTTNTIDKTKQNVVIYGRGTYESLNKVLPNRHNIILSTSIQNINDANVCDSLSNAMELVKSLKTVENVFICGGKKIYEESMCTNIIDEYIVTYIKDDYDCDTFINLNIDNDYNIKSLYSDSNIDIYHYY